MSSTLETISAAMAESQLAAAVAAVSGTTTSRLFGDAARGLTDEEVEQLQTQGNRAGDWSLVLAGPGFTTDHVWNSRFLGHVALGAFSGEPRDLGDGLSLPSGVSDSTIQDSEIGNEAVVSHVGVLANTIVHATAAVVQTASVTGSGQTQYGCGRELPLGIETGGRDVRVYAEITIGVAQALACRRDDETLQTEYSQQLDEYLSQVSGDRTIVDSGAVIRDSDRVVDSYVGTGAIVSGARLVAGSCLLSNPEEPAVVSGGAWVKNSILQWAAEVESLGLVDSSVLCEHSHVERHGKLTESILGPNSGVGEGEVTASLVGPFVGFHHQSLLIAAVWPEGKGNVGYGANVGSNHTGKAPDQEIWCGEGTFFGLGVDVKFPSDFTGSPYSILASGITCLPQRLEFPFSLINSPSTAVPELSPSINELFPGWVLEQNIYMIKRNEGKYLARNKARREEFVFEVFRPDIVRLMQDARDRLAKAEPQELYTSRDIPGLGKNYVTARAVASGIATYDFYINYYARLGLKEQLEQRELTCGTAAASTLLSTASEDQRWEHQRAILGSDTSPAEALGELIVQERTIAENVEQSKAKDDTRGARVIDDYAVAHSPAAEDGFVTETWERFRQVEADTQALLSD